MFNLNSFKDFFVNKSFNSWIFISLFITFFLSFPIISLIFNVVINYNSEWNIVLNIEIWNYLYNSLFIIFFQSIFVIFFGVSCAWIVSTYDFPFRKIIDLFLLLPLSIPPYIAAIAYGELFDYSSYFQIFVRENIPFLNDINFLKTIPYYTGIFTYNSHYIPTWYWYGAKHVTYIPFASDESLNVPKKTKLEL